MTCMDGSAHTGCTKRKRDLADFTERLRAKAHKITAPRQAILRALHARDHPLTIKEIVDALPGAACDLATVYRSIHLLEQMSLVKRFDFGDGVARYELLDEGDDGHHHHLICTGCSAVVELDDCFPPDLEHRIAERNGYRAVTHRLEFFGLCPACQT